MANLSCGGEITIQGWDRLNSTGSLAAWPIHVKIRSWDQTDLLHHAAVRCGGDQTGTGQPLEIERPVALALEDGGTSGTQHAARLIAMERSCASYVVVIDTVVSDL